MWPRFCLLVLTWTQVQCGADIQRERKVSVNLTDSLEKLDIAKNHDFDSRVSTYLDFRIYNSNSQKICEIASFLKFLLYPL